MTCPYLHALGCLAEILTLVFFLIPCRELERDNFYIYSVTHREGAKYQNPWHKIGDIDWIELSIFQSKYQSLRLLVVILGNYEIALIVIPFPAIFCFHLC